MKKIFFTILLACTVLVLLAVVAAGVFLSTFNPNDYKSHFSQAINKATGLQLLFEGDLEVALFPEIGLKTGRLVLLDANAAGGEAFASVEAARARLALEPLLKQELVVEEVALAGALVNLRVDAAGNKNWESLLDKGKKGGSASAAQSPAASGASAATGASATSAMDDSPAVVPLQAPEDKITDAQSKGKKSFALRIREVSSSGARLVYRDARNGDHYSLALGDLTLTEPDLDKDLDLALAGTLLDEKSGHKGAFALDAKARAGSDGSFAAGIGSFKVTAAGLLPAPLTLEAQSQVHFDPQSGRLSLRQTAGSLSAPSPGKNLKAFACAFQLSADLVIGKGDKLALTVDFQADKLDLDALLAIADAEAVKAAGQTGGAPNMPRPKVAAAGSAAAGQKSGASGPDLTGLTGLGIEAQLRVGQLDIEGQRLSNISTRLHLAGNKAKAPFSAQLHGGAIKGQATLDLTGKVPAIGLSMTVKDLNLEQATRSLTGKYTITGLAAASADLSAVGADAKAILASLKGKAAFQARSGEVRGFKLIPADLPNIAAVPETFAYEQLSASAVIASGTATSKDILLVSALLGGRGGGLARLAQGQLDLGLDFMLANLPPAVPVSISGPYANLSYSVDMPTFLRNVAQSALRDPESAVDLLRKPAEAVKTLKDPENAKGLLRNLGGQLFRQ